MGEEESEAAGKRNTFRLPGLSLDLEIGRADSRIQAIGAVRTDTGESLSEARGGLSRALRRLDEFADGASFLLGHNLIAFDLPHLAAADPALRLLNLPAIDTLRLSPLAFPRNPYHHLVKHYKDGALKRERRNDPELDARLALEVFGDQCCALTGAESDLLASWHWLSTPDPDNADRALDRLFHDIRGSWRPSDEEARDAISHAPGRCSMRIAGAPGPGDGRAPTLGDGIRSRLDLRVRRQFGDAALGALPVPGGGTTGPVAPGCRLCGPGMPLVPGAP